MRDEWQRPARRCRANPERAEQPLPGAGPEARHEPFHRIGLPQMAGARDERLPERREKEVGVADEPRLALSDGAARDAPAGIGMAGWRQAVETARAEQAEAGAAHVDVLVFARVVAAARTPI